MIYAYFICDCIELHMPTLNKETTTTTITLISNILYSKLWFILHFVMWYLFYSCYQYFTKCL